MSFWVQFPHLTFDEESHVYRWKGIEVPSVTGIFDRLGHRKNDQSPWVPFGCPDFAKREHDSTFGKAFHKLANAMVCGKEVSFPEEMLPWHNKLQRFLSKYQLEPLFDPNGNIIAEYPMYCDSVGLGYAGIPDFCCRELKSKNVWVVDWKTGAYQKSYGWQTAGYSKLLSDVFGGQLFDRREKITRVTVCFIADQEEPKPEFRYNNPEDIIAFQSLLNTYRLAA